MEKNFENSFFLTRHSIKPKGEDKESPEYPGISEKGVELARQRATDLMKMLSEAEAGTVMFIGGASVQERTKSTARIYGEEMKKIVNTENHEDFLIIDKSNIVGIAQDEKGYSKTMQKIQEIITANPDKKIAIDLPLALKNFENPDWNSPEGKVYVNSLLERSGNNDPVKAWIAENGEHEDLKGPSPLDCAKEYIKGLKRLEEFASKNIPDRPLIIGGAAHSAELDAAIVYLANNGIVNTEGYEKICEGKIIGETEMMKIELKANQSKLIYRNNEHSIIY